MTFPFNYLNKADGIWICQKAQTLISVFTLLPALHLERVQLLSFWTFEGKWWLCSIKYFMSDKAAWERGDVTGKNGVIAGKERGARRQPLMVNSGWTLEGSRWPELTFSPFVVLSSHYNQEMLLETTWFSQVTLHFYKSDFTCDTWSSKIAHAYISIIVI